MGGAVGRPLHELVVIVPGILGSRLDRVDADGHRREVWGTGAATLVKNVLTFGKSIKSLAIKPDVDPAAPGDGILATSPITDQVIIPGFLAICGYDGLMSTIQQRCGLRDDQVTSFAYDWRLSCRVGGDRLAKFLAKEVPAWRERSGHATAKAILVCHSMGGLVARWCTEVEGGHEWVSRTVTIGTPYQGAAMALQALFDGVRLPKRIGPRFDDLVRSLPSVRELLPTYACVRVGGDLKLLDEVDALPATWVADGFGFHRDLASATRDAARTDRLTAFRGGLQPTLTSASWSKSGGAITMFERSDGTDEGFDDRGDGTVPRISALPVDWPDPATAKTVSQRHASMQGANSVADELAVIFTDAPAKAAREAGLGLRLPEAVEAGKQYEIWVEADSGLGLAVTASSIADGVRSQAVPAKRADGRYVARMPALAPGLYDITVSRRGEDDAPVEPVSDLMLAFDQVV